MQSEIQRRFFIIFTVILMTTIAPWLIWGYALQPKPGEDRKAIPYELKFGLDLKGGASITYRVAAAEGQDQQKILTDAIRITQRRLDAFGLSEISITESGNDQFTVELPGRGKEEIDRIKNVMRQVGNLEFRIVATPEVEQQERSRREREAATYVVTPGYRWVPNKEGEQREETLVETFEERTAATLASATKALKDAETAGKGPSELEPLQAAVTAASAAHEAEKARLVFLGDDIGTAGVERNTQGLGYVVTFAMKARRSAAFGDFTGSNIKRQMAILLNGVIETAPEIKSKLPGGGQISSDFAPYTQATAQDLVTVLQSGSIATKPEEISSFIVGPGLGDEAVRRGAWALGLSTLLVVIAMVLYYRGAGWVANLAVVLNIVMTLGVLTFLGAALTLPGIAGLVLTLGMAVDANILVNERIREEKEAGRGLAQAIAAGYERAWITILDSNLTTILAGIVLYWVGTGPIRGFALTLVLGLGISMFTACFVTRTIFMWGLHKGILTEFRMAPILTVPNIAYTSLRRTTMGASAILLVLGTIAFVVRDRYEKYDLEFTGGQRVIVALRSMVPITEVRAALAEAGLGETGIRTIRGRGTESADIDLATSSDTFEITARSSDEEAGREFEALARKALEKYILPPGIEWRGAGPAGEGGKIPVTAAVNLTGGVVTADSVKDAVKGSALFGTDETLKVEASTGASDGVTSFVISANVAAGNTDLETSVHGELRRVLTAVPGLQLSEPVAQSDFIGPGVANRLREQAIIAVLLSTLAQIVYLRFRFRDFTYGFAAAIIVAHNVLITLGIVAVADAMGFAHVKINLPVIASFLTLIGYSVNDTIVVFDRIRENLGRRTHPTQELIDRAISDTLARSIRTSVTVFLVALTLFLFNWNASSSIEGFSFVMVIGVLASAYASVFISSPLLLFLPVYSVSLKKLPQAVVLGLILALFVGLGVAATQDGAIALVAGTLACLLPLHFLGHLVLWLRQPNPDLLLETAD